MVKTKHKVWTYAGITLLVILYVLINNVNLNPLYQGSALFYAVVITLYVGAWGVLKLGGMHFVRDENSPRVNVQFGDNQKFPKLAKWLLIAVWAFLIVVTIASSVIFNVNAYKNQMTEPIVGEFTDDIQPMDLNNIPIVDKDLAKKLAEKKLGENPSLGSQTHIGTPTIQQVNGKLIWAVPLQHSGLFKWLSTAPPAISSSRPPTPRTCSWWRATRSSTSPTAISLTTWSGTPASLAAASSPG